MANGKVIAKNTIYLYIRMFLVMGVSLYTVRVVINTLGVVDYGIFTAVGGIVLLMSFLSQTISSAAQRFFSFELGKNNHQKLGESFIAILIIYLTIAVLVAILAEVGGLWFLEHKMVVPEERMDAAHYVLHFSLLTFIVHILHAPYNAMIIAHENMKVYAYISIIEVLLKLGIVFLLGISSVDRLSFYSFLLLCTSVVVAAMYILYCYHNYIETHFLFRPRRKIFTDITRYASWTMFGSVAFALNNQGVGLLLNTFFGPIANSSQSIANQVSNALQLFGTNLFAAIRPPMTKYYAQGCFQEVVNLFYQSSKFVLFLLLLIIVPLFFEMRFILELWLGSVTAYMVDFARLMLMYVILIQVSNPITIIVQAANQVKKYHTIVDGFSLITLVVSYVFLSLGYPAQTVYIVMISVMFIAHFIRLYLLHSFLSYSYIEYAKKVIVPFLIISIVVSCLTLRIHTLEFNKTTIFFMSTFLSVLFNIILIYTVGLNRHERNFVLTICKRYIIRK